MKYLPIQYDKELAPRAAPRTRENPFAELVTEDTYLMKSPLKFTPLSSLISASDDRRAARRANRGFSNSGNFATLGEGFSADSARSSNDNIRNHSRQSLPFKGGYTRGSTTYNPKQQGSQGKRYSYRQQQPQQSVGSPTSHTQAQNPNGSSPINSSRLAFVR